MNRRQLLSWSFFWIYTFNVLFSKVLPPEELPSFLLLLDDKLLHAFEHFLLFFFALAAFSVSNRAWLQTRAVGASFFYCLLIGALIEFEQSLVPYRHAEFADWIADLVGTLVAWGSFHAFPFLKKIFLGPPPAP